jgi:hypothetical protein
MLPLPARLAAFTPFAQIHLQLSFGVEIYSSGSNFYVTWVDLSLFVFDPNLPLW